MKAYTVSVPPPILHWIWLYIDTIIIVENKYLPIDFFIMDWEYPAQIFVNFTMYVQMANISTKPP